MSIAESAYTSSGSVTATATGAHTMELDQSRLAGPNKSEEDKEEAELKPPCDHAVPAPASTSD